MDTIVAISTAPGLGGIGIIRLSGETAFDILLKIFKSNKIKNKEDIKANTINYGHIIEDGEIIDEVLVSFFKAPHSYTTEDVVEINTHGGNIVCHKILNLAIKNGASLADSGEFTKRAFINGRIDLTKVESIASILGAKSEEELKVSNKLLKGKLLDKINLMKKNILEVLMHIEVNIDYPEYDTEEKTMDEVKVMLTEVKKELSDLSETFDVGNKIREGFSVSIIGRPNAGKSSLLNYILDKERAIVTDIEGTTRDSIEEIINIKGMPVKIIDTAGIRETDEKIEQIGIERALEYAKSSDVIIAIFDSNKELTKDDINILDLCKDKDSIIVLNKMDLETKINIEEIKNIGKEIIKVSALKKEGLNEIVNSISLRLDKLKETKSNDIIIIHERQKKVIEEALKSTEEALKSSEILPVDMLSEYIQNILEKLNELTGEDIKEEILNEIFSNFCLGK